MKEESQESQQTKDEEFVAEVKLLVAEAEAFNQSMFKDRQNALNIYNGDMDDFVDVRPGWSQVTSKAVSATIKKVLPSLTRVFLANEIISTYQPTRESTQDDSEQITDYVNLVVIPECCGDKAIEDSIFDAALYRNGLLYSGTEEKKTVTGAKYTGLDEIALGKLLSEDGVEVLEADSKHGDIDPQTGMPIQLYDVKIKRVTKEYKEFIRAIPPEEFLINSSAIDCQTANICGRVMRMSKSELVALGYDEALVEELQSDSNNQISDAEKFQRRPTALNLGNTFSDDELQMVKYYDLYVRSDYDDDGIAELRHVVIAGSINVENVLVNEYAEFIPYSDIKIMNKPHQWEGESLVDDLKDIQIIETALLRYAMDNTYQHVNPQPIINVDKLKGGNADAVMNPEPGRPIFVTGVDKSADAVTYNQIPYVADKAMAAVQYWDAQISNRTGIDDSSAGLPEDALQNVTAKASAMMEQKGIAQTEYMVRTIARGLRVAFINLLRVIVSNQDKKRTVRLRDQWVDIDPRSWDATMDVTINVGLGAGSRERDMAVMRQILQMQQVLVQQFGPESPILKADNIYNAVAKAVSSAGIKSVNQFFTKPDPQEVAAALEAKRNAPNPEMIKAQAQMQIDKQSHEHQMQIEQMQAEADIKVKNHAALVDAELKQRLAEIDAAKHSVDTAHNQFIADNALKMKQMEIASKEAMHKATLQNDLDKHNAQAIGNAVTAQDEAENIPAKDAGPKLVEVLDKLHKSMTAPRKLVRDKSTGDVIGLETAAH